MLATGRGIAQEKPSPEPLRVSKFPGSAGLRHYSPNTWGIVDVAVENRGDEAASTQVTSYFESEPTQQYGRRIWVPANSKRSTWYSVLPPGTSRPEEERYNLKSLQLSTSAERAGAAQRSPPQPIATSWLSAKHRGLVTGIIQDTDATGDNYPYELAVALRVAQGMPRDLSAFHGEFLPPIPSALEGMDQLIVCSDRPASDFTGLAAIRHWLLGGGRLWIMLDRVSSETAGLLLEEAYDCEVVDRVGLTELAIEPVDNRTAGSGTIEFEEPIEFVRVIPGSANVTHNVNGWPAAFWKKAGRGRVICTTLGARAWLREPPEDKDDDKNERRQDRRSSSKFRSTDELISLGRLFLTSPDPLPIEMEQLQPMLTQQIGYEIVGRKTLLVLLSGFCLALTFMGLALARRKRLEWIGWLGPIFALGVAMVIVVLGAQSRRTVPNTVAVLQVVETSPDSEHMNVQGVAAIFNRNRSNAVIGATSEGQFVPDATGLSGRVRRVIRTDMNRWHIENLELPAGVRFAPFQISFRNPSQVRVQAVFGPGGLQGRLTRGPFESLADAVITTEAGQTAGLRFDDLSDPDAFSVSTSDVLAPGEFISGALLSDQQRRRQNVYRQVVPGANSKPFPGEPTFMAWAPRLDLGFDFPDQEKQIGSALVLAPLELDRSPPGSRVLIPSPFLAYRMDSSREASLAYSNKDRRWQARQRGATTWLRVQFPDAVLPLRVDSITVTLHIKGPSNKLEIAGIVEGQVTVLASKEDPLGTLNFTINRSDALQLDEQGGLILGVLVAGLGDDNSDPSDFEGEKNKWQIEYLHLEAQGQTRK